MASRLHNTAMPEQPPELPQFPPVGEAESGQKLLALLMRRLSLPQALLHRWLRTGQIRVNGRRCKPFATVQTGDIIRLPPFALKLTASLEPDFPELPKSGNLPPLLGEWKGIWVFNKPAGLAVQGGSGITDSLCGRLSSQYANLAFCPTPAHRLDRDTSGILLVGATFSALQKLQTAFRTGRIHKEYLAWIAGEWPWQQKRLLRHFITDSDKIIAHAEPGPNRAEAKCIVAPLRQFNSKSLVHIRLLTGRKRQLRAQLAACGHPVVGDSRYGQKGLLKLHACRVILPDNGPEFSCLPPWQDEYEVSQLPPAMSPLNMPTPK